MTLSTCLPLLIPATGSSVLLQALDRRCTPASSRPLQNNSELPSHLPLEKASGCEPLGCVVTSPFVLAQLSCLVWESWTYPLPISCLSLLVAFQMAQWAFHCLLPDLHTWLKASLYVHLWSPLAVRLTDTFHLSLWLVWQVRVGDKAFMFLKMWAL